MRLTCVSWPLAELDAVATNSSMFPNSEKKLPDPKSISVPGGVTHCDGCVLVSQSSPSRPQPEQVLSHQHPCPLRGAVTVAAHLAVRAASYGNSRPGTRPWHFSDR
jgi:hypothetical protein